MIMCYAVRDLAEELLNPERSVVRADKPEVMISPTEAWLTDHLLQFDIPLSSTWLSELQPGGRCC